ncbi:MAG TPA: hypothetical protein VGP33_02310 [Chloroflexota bacterium]|nr:hypothetical protein [Chloroflexota bacterium]
MQAADSALSHDPADVLIRNLLPTRRAATTGEINGIAQRMATAPFPTAEEPRRRHCDDGQWTELVVKVVVVGIVACRCLPRYRWRSGARAA